MSPGGALAPGELEMIKRSRRHPRPTQFDWLHMRRLVDDLRDALASLPPGTADVLDVFCGSRPYDDLMPAGARVVGLDVPGNPYGVADVVSEQFLPFPDGSFDLVTCIEAFHYVEEPAAAVAEFRRVLRSGGTVLIAIPFVWEYDRSILERRHTGPELAHLLQGWDDVRVVENGGRAVVWTTLSGTLLERLRGRLPAPLAASFSLVYVSLNALGLLLDAVDRRASTGSVTLPMNLLVTARRPDGG